MLTPISTPYTSEYKPLGLESFAAPLSKMQEKFDALVKSQGYVTTKDYQMLEALAAKLEARIDTLERLLEEDKAK